MVTEQAENPERVLLLTFARRGEEDVIRGARAALQEAHPGATAFAVATTESEPALRAAGISELVTLDGSRSASAVLREVAARRPTAVAVVYSDSAWQGHLKLEIVALWSRARAIYRCGPDGSRQAMTRASLWASVAVKGLQAALRLGAGALAAGTAFCWLRTAQALSGGNRADRA